MSKIICDVCGSAYADTADQCPICGTAKRDTNATKPESQSEGGYNYVKGGRFSHANVPLPSSLVNIPHPTMELILKLM